MPRFDDADFAVDAAPAPHETHSPRERGSMVDSLPIPHDAGNTIDIPATRSSISDAAQYMHNLSLSPSMRDRRGSRNSFGTSLPTPRSPLVSRLASVVTAEAISRDILASQVQDMSKEKAAAAKDMAFAFDIDGVLAHGNEPIEEAKEALKMLNGDNELGIKIPYILLTNGGGKTEQARCQQLSEILEVPISTDQFIQSHTPMQTLAEYYDTVLVCGGEGQKIREVAENYGFKNVVHPKDILAWDPTISPWGHFTAEDRAEAKPRDFSKVKFDAILVFADSHDYATDMQLIIDLLLSEDGRLLTRAKDPVASRIPIYFSQGDLWFPTDHKGPPRLTQGPFRISIEAQYKHITGIDLERVVYGKPERATYTYADEVLRSWMEEIHNENRLPKNVYMIGDNPQSDIVGGNMYGWNTCLVRTGVFQGGDNDENNPASFGVFPNVLEAVKAAVRKELGHEFKFKWNPKVNPVLHGDGGTPAAAAAKQAVRRRMKDRWTKQWEQEKGSKPTRRLVKTPGKDVLKLYKDLSKPHAAMIIQMRTMRIGLNHFLYKIKARNCDRCSCGEGSQTTKHVLLQCSLHADARKKLFDELTERGISQRGQGRGTWDYDTLMANPLAICYIAKFMEQIDLLGQFKHIERPSQESNRPSGQGTGTEDDG